MITELCCLLDEEVLETMGVLGLGHEVGEQRRESGESGLNPAV